MSHPNPRIERAIEHRTNFAIQRLLMGKILSGGVGGVDVGADVERRVLAERDRAVRAQGGVAITPREDYPQTTLGYAQGGWGLRGLARQDQEIAELDAMRLRRRADRAREGRLAMIEHYENIAQQRREAGGVIRDAWRQRQERRAGGGGASAVYNGVVATSLRFGASQAMSLPRGGAGDQPDDPDLD